MLNRVVISLNVRVQMCKFPDKCVQHLPYTILQSVLLVKTELKIDSNYILLLHFSPCLALKLNQTKRNCQMNSYKRLQLRLDSFHNSTHMQNEREMWCYHIETTTLFLPEIINFNRRYYQKMFVVVSFQTD